MVEQLFFDDRRAGAADGCDGRLMILMMVLQPPLQSVRLPISFGSLLRIRLSSEITLHSSYNNNHGGSPLHAPVPKYRKQLGRRIELRKRVFSA